MFWDLRHRYGTCQYNTDRHTATRYERLRDKDKQRPPLDSGTHSSLDRYHGDATTGPSVALHTTGTPNNATRLFHLCPGQTSCDTWRHESQEALHTRARTKDVFFEVPESRVQTKKPRTASLGGTLQRDPIQHGDRVNKHTLLHSRSKVPPETKRFYWITPQSSVSYLCCGQQSDHRSIVPSSRRTKLRHIAHIMSFCFCLGP